MFVICTKTLAKDTEGGKALAEVAQEGCGCTDTASVQGQVRWGLEQSGLVEDVPAYGRGGWK